MKEWRGTDENKLYATMDLLGERQEKTENALAKKQLANGCQVRANA